MRNQRGNALIEFTLAGIPLIFLLISTFELARGLWVYTTMAHALREGVRFAIVHGNNCALFPNACRTQVRDVLGRIDWQGVGLMPDDFQDIRLISASRTITCPTITDCLGNSGLGVDFWPTAAPGSANADAGGIRGGDLEITARYRFRSAMALLWPGAGPGSVLGEKWFTASSKERLQY